MPFRLPCPSSPASKWKLPSPRKRMLTPRLRYDTWCICSVLLQLLYQYIRVVRVSNEVDKNAQGIRARYSHNDIYSQCLWARVGSHIQRASGVYELRFLLIRCQSNLVAISLSASHQINLARTKSTIERNTQESMNSSKKEQALIAWAFRSGEISLYI